MECLAARGEIEPSGVEPLHSGATVEPLHCGVEPLLPAEPLLLRDTIAASIFDGSRRTSARHQASKRPRVQLPPMVKFGHRQQDSLTSLVAAADSAT